MKHVIIVTMILAAFITGKSQDKPQRPSMQEHLKRTQEIFLKELQLNANQQQKMATAFEEFMLAAQKLRAENPPPPPPPPSAKVKAAMNKLVAERDAKIQLALTVDQYAKYLEVAKTVRPPHPGPDNANQPSPPPPVNQ